MRAAAVFNGRGFPCGAPRHAPRHGPVGARRPAGLHSLDEVGTVRVFAALPPALRSRGRDRQRLFCRADDRSTGAVGITGEHAPDPALLRRDPGRKHCLGSHQCSTIPACVSPAIRAQPRRTSGSFPRRAARAYSGSACKTGMEEMGAFWKLFTEKLEPLRGRLRAFRGGRPTPRGFAPHVTVARAGLDARSARTGPRA